MLCLRHHKKEAYQDTMLSAQDATTYLDHEIDVSHRLEHTLHNIATSTPAALALFGNMAAPFMHCEEEGPEIAMAIYLATLALAGPLIMAAGAMAGYFHDIGLAAQEAEKDVALLGTGSFSKTNLSRRVSRQARHGLAIGAMASFATMTMLVASNEDEPAFLTEAPRPPATAMHYQEGKGLDGDDDDGLLPRQALRVKFDPKNLTVTVIGDTAAPNDFHIS
jgi:hypothetical protein